MQIYPLGGYVLLTPELNSEIQAREVKERSGLLLLKPENKLENFEGKPSQAYIAALPKDYLPSGKLKVGMHVAFRWNRDKKPRKVEWDDKKYLRIAIEDIEAIIE